MHEPGHAHTSSLMDHLFSNHGHNQLNCQFIIAATLGASLPSNLFVAHFNVGQVGWVTGKCILEEGNVEHCRVIIDEFEAEHFERVRVIELLLCSRQLELRDQASDNCVHLNKFHLKYHQINKSQTSVENDDNSK